VTLLAFPQNPPFQLQLKAVAGQMSRMNASCSQIHFVNRQRAQWTGDNPNIWTWRN
jgi:hypothetical protein